MPLLTNRSVAGLLTTKLSQRTFHLNVFDKSTKKFTQNIIKWPLDPQSLKHHVKTRDADLTGNDKIWAFIQRVCFCVLLIGDDIKYTAITWMTKLTAGKYGITPAAVRSRTFWGFFVYVKAECLKYTEVQFPLLFQRNPYERETWSATTAWLWWRIRLWGKTLGAKKEKIREAVENCRMESLLSFGIYNA